MQIFVLRQDGVQAGPFTEDQIRTMDGNGQLALDDLLWHEGLSDWVLVDSPTGSYILASSRPPVPSPRLRPPIDLSGSRYVPEKTPPDPNPSNVQKVLSNVLLLFLCGCLTFSVVVGLRIFNPKSTPENVTSVTENRPVLSEVAQSGYRIGFAEGSVARKTGYPPADEYTLADAANHLGGTLGFFELEKLSQFVQGYKTGYRDGYKSER